MMPNESYGKQSYSDEEYYGQGYYDIRNQRNGGRTLSKTLGGLAIHADLMQESFEHFIDDDLGYWTYQKGYDWAREKKLNFEQKKSYQEPSHFTRPAARPRR